MRGIGCEEQNPWNIVIPTQKEIDVVVIDQSVVI